MHAGEDRRQESAGARFGDKDRSPQNHQEEVEHGQGDVRAMTDCLCLGVIPVCVWV